MKILITGGHLAPALAVIDEIEKSAQIVYVGRKYNLDSEKNFSLEYQEIAKRAIPFYHLQTGRFTRLLSLKLIQNALKIPLGLYQSFAILKKERPNLILTFGGYIGFPISLIGFVLGVPIYIHEQTLRPGLANRLTGILARKILVAFSDAKKYFPENKVSVSGNPVRKNVLGVDKIPFLIKKTRPVIYITGGSLGSHSVNIHVEKILPLLLAKYIVIHQTGSISEYRNFNRLEKIKNKLTKDLKSRYYLREQFRSDEIGYVYSNCDLVVGRSGANTIFELIALKIPAVLIPLPWSANGEQLKQAELLRKAGVALIFHQNFASIHLFHLIEKMMIRIDYYKNNFKNVELLYNENAAKVIVQTVLSQSHT